MFIFVVISYNSWITSVNSTIRMWEIRGCTIGKNHRNVRRHHISRRYPFCEATLVIDVQNTITAAVWSIRRRPSTVRGGRSGRGGGEEQRICGFLRSIVHTFGGYVVGSYLREALFVSRLVRREEKEDTDCERRLAKWPREERWLSPRVGARCFTLIHYTSLRRPSAGRSTIHETPVSEHYSAFTYVTLHPRTHIPLCELQPACLCLSVYLPSEFRWIRFSALATPPPLLPRRRSEYWRPRAPAWCSVVVGDRLVSRVGILKFSRVLILLCPFDIEPIWVSIFLSFYFQEKLSFLPLF